MIVASNVLCDVAVVYVYVEAAGICTSVRAQGVFKGKHQQKLGPKTEKLVTKHPGLCHEGDLKVL